MQGTLALRLNVSEDLHQWFPHTDKVVCPSTLAQAIASSQALASNSPLTPTCMHPQAVCMPRGNEILERWSVVQRKHSPNPFKFVYHQMKIDI